MSSRKGHRLQPSASHLKSDAELLVTKVTPYSFWFDQWWYEDNPAGGGKSFRVNWFKNFSTSELEDTRCRKLIDAARRVTEAMRYPVLTKPKSRSTVYGQKARRLLDLVAWMYRNAVWTFAELTPEVTDWYKSDLLEAGPEDVDLDEEQDQREQLASLELVSDQDDQSVSKLSKRLRILVDLFELSDEFANFPELRLAVHPLRGQSATSVAESLAISSEGWIPRIPDDVFNPLMKEALNWVDIYSRDILHAQAEYFRVMDSRRKYTGHNYHKFTDAALIKVRFDSCGELPRPWRAPLLPSAANRKVLSSNDPARGPTTQLRGLIDSLEAAGLVSVQAITGTRVSELLQAKVGLRQTNGWPACLVQRPSRSGLYDLFYLSSRTFKGEADDEGTPFEWLLGVRPAGTDFLPIAVRGILMLDKLFTPWRGRFQCDYLVMSLGKGGSLPHLAPVNMKPLNERYARILKRFLAEHVKLPGEFTRWNLTSHQFRKTYCQDIVRINPRALPGIQEHFGHASAYITDEAYTGNDATMLMLIDDVATREAAKIMVDRVFGKVAMGGKLADIIDASEAMIRELLEGEDTYDRRVTALANALSVEGIKLFTSDYLDCFFRPEHAMCHRDLLGHFDKDATRPLRPYRTKKNCSVCQNGLIHRHHTSYWEEEYRSNEQIRRANVASGDLRIAAVASAQAAQAKSVLRKIGSWPVHEKH